MGFMQDLIRFSAGLEQAFMVSIAFDQIAVDALKALFRYLRAGGIVEKYRRAFKGGKLLTNEMDICIEPG